MMSVSVLVTRPEVQAEAFIRDIVRQGWHAQPFSTLEIAPLELKGAEKQKVLDLDLYHVVICVSPNAAELGMSAISDYWPQMPVRQHWIAVGPATAEVLKSWGISPLVPQSGSNSESVLQMPELQSVDAQRILILKGEGGRNLISNALRMRGAKVDYLHLYTRKQPDHDPQVLCQWLTAGYSKRVITVTSGDALKHLLALGEQVRESLLELPIVVVSERLQRFARSQGFSEIWVSEGAGIPALMQCLKQHLIDSDAT